MYFYNANYPTTIITVNTYQCPKCFTCVAQNIPTTIIAVLQKRKPWPQEVLSLAQGHLAGCGCHGGNLGGLAPDPKLSTTHWTYISRAWIYSPSLKLLFALKCPVYSRHVIGIGCIELDFLWNFLELSWLNISEKTKQTFKKKKGYQVLLSLGLLNSLLHSRIEKHLASWSCLMWICIRSNIVF